MTKRNIMRAFKLREISAVDRPAQAGALMTLMKRFDDASDDDAIKGITANPGGGGPGNNGGDPMPDDVKKQLDELQAKMDAAEKKQAETDAKLAAAEKKATDAEAALVIADQIGKMSDDEKEHYGQCKDDEKTKFLAMDKAARTAEIIKRKAGDETITIAGQSITKSKVGDAMFAVLKAQNEQIETQGKQLAKAQEEAAMAGFTKRADDELGQMPGTTVEKAAVLKAVDALPEAVKGTLNKMLEAGANAMKSAYTRVGHGSGKEPVSKEAGDLKKQVDDKIDAIVKRDNISRDRAMQKARAENPDLFKQYREASFS